MGLTVDSRIKTPDAGIQCFKLNQKSGQLNTGQLVNTGQLNTTHQLSNVMTLTHFHHNITQLMSCVQLP